MFGNLINNKQITDLREAGIITITPFDQKLLKAVHYPLHVKSVYRREPDGTWRRRQSFDEDTQPFILEPHEYVVVEIREAVVLKEGILGQFLTASNLIEGGLGLTAGRIEYPFGQRGETIRFGVCNQLNVPNQINSYHHVAYIQFFDLRGLSSRLIIITQEELDFLAKRISEGRKLHGVEDGVFPMEGSGYQIDMTKK